MPSTENENLSGLGDFFSLISSEKKKKDEEVQSLIGDLGSVLLELDKASKQTKAVKKKQTKVKKVKKEPEVKVDVSNLFDELATLKKKEEEKKKREKEEIKAFESWLFTQPSEIKEEIIETPEEPEEVVIEEETAAIEEPEETEQVTEQVADQEEIEEEVEEEPEEKDEENATVSQVLETLKTLIKDDIVEEKDTEIESLKKEIKDLRNLLYQGLRDISAQGGGGEVRLEFLDDISRDAAKVDGKFLKYDANSGKWVGDNPSASASEESQKLVLEVRNNNVGYALTIGTPVYQTGYNSGQDRINIEEARASQPSTMPAKGVIKANLDNNTNGEIIVYGELEGVDTSSFEVADELYVAPGGGLTNSRPSGVNDLVQKIAVVLKKSVNGAILVYGAGRTNDVPNTISVGGSITAGSFYGDGSGLTGVANTAIINADTVNVSGVVTATQFVGDGSGLTGIVASGSGIVIRHESSLVGTAATINFNDGINASIESGVATIDADMDMGTF